MQEGQEEAAASEKGSCAHSGGLWTAVSNGGPASQGPGHSSGSAHQARPPEQDMTMTWSFLKCFDAFSHLALYNLYDTIHAAITMARLMGKKL